jgi:PAS domain S-box-containing protein
VVLPPVEYTVSRTTEEIGLGHIEGRARWIQCHLSPVKNANDEIVFVVNTYMDITERKKAEVALKESENDLIKAQEVGRIGSWRLDLLKNKLTWTDEIYRIFGVPKGTPMDYERFLEIVHPEDRDYVDREWRAATKGRPYDIEHRLLVDDEVKWVREKAELGFDDKSNPVRAVGIVQEITERKKAEEEARRHQDALARVDRASSMGQLTGSIAHELNQPLTGILSNAQAAELIIETLRESGWEEHGELAEIMVEIVADTKRAGDVIRNLRELYRKQGGRFSPVDINAIVDETTLLLQSEFVLHHIELTTECAASIPAVDGNKIQIQQVLMNLIVNGNQAMRDSARDDRRLHIATEYDESEVVAWVEDCGPGLDADRIDRIFEPLATWKPGGMGMGLAISNTIVQAHGGRMFAENKVGGGARVGFALPALKEGPRA